MHFQGLEIDVVKSLFLCQQKYTRVLLQKFGMVDCKLISTPTQTNKRLNSYEGDVLKDLAIYRYSLKV